MSAATTLQLTLGEVAAAVGGAVPAKVGARRITRVTTDSRALQQGDLFVALKGENFDGHDFVERAFAAGAAGALVSRDARARYPEGAACIAVPDPRLALGALARNWRARFPLPLIAVVGSNGKTTVTQMLASILREHAGTGAFHTIGNFNNDIGLPLTLLRLRATHTIGVVELGMNHRGEIAYLADIATPTIALVNNAQREHQEFLKTIAEVAEENASVFDALPGDGIAIVNADDAHAAAFVAKAGGRRVVTFGMANPADVRGSFVGESGEEERSKNGSHASNETGAAFGSHLRIALPDGEADVVLRIAGRHNAMNAVAAAAAASAAGIRAATIARGLNAFVPVAGRLVKNMLPSGAVLLDDTYNANPDSVRAAIDVLAATGGRRVLVLGRMAEVGEQGPAFHREVGGYASERKIDALFTFGPEAAEAAHGFGPAAQAFDDLDALIERTHESATAGTTLLVKGSRSARMERVVRALLGQDARHEEAH